MVASCWSFLYTLYYDAQNHEHQGYIFFSFITKLQYAMKSTFFLGVMHVCRLNEAISSTCFKQCE
jgi:hypothetical protein